MPPHAGSLVAGTPSCWCPSCGRLVPRPLLGFRRTPSFSHRPFAVALVMQPPHICGTHFAAGCSLLQSLQLYPSPVTNLGTIGALRAVCCSFVAAVLMLQSLVTAASTAAQARAGPQGWVSPCAGTWLLDAKGLVPPHARSLVAGPHGGRPPAGFSAAAAPPPSHWWVSEDALLLPPPFGCSVGAAATTLQAVCCGLHAALTALQFAVSYTLQLHPFPLPIQELLGLCTQNVAALWLRCLCCRRCYSQLYPIPVTPIQVLSGLCNQSAVALWLHCSFCGPCCWRLFHALRWARLWRPVWCSCRMCVAASCVAPAHCTGSAQRTPSLHSEC